MKMNKSKYRHLKGAKDLRLGQGFTFQQDKDLKHTAQTTKEWLQDK